MCPMARSAWHCALRITAAIKLLGLPGLRHVTKQFDCSPQLPAPSCQPSSNQVAIFSEINYQGDCQLLGDGSYPQSSYLGLVGDNNTKSILVGANLQAQLFTETNYAGRSEILRRNDSNLSDNLTASGTLSSIKVSARTPSAAAATLELSDTSILMNSISAVRYQFHSPLLGYPGG